VIKPVRIIPLVLALSIGLLSAAETPDTRAALAQLLAGVKKIGAPGSPGLVCVFGPQAFPVVLGQAGKDTKGCVVAAARSRKGRLVAFAHSGYFDGATLKVGDTGRLMANCVRWAANGKKAPRVATWKKDQLRARHRLGKFLLRQGRRKPAGVKSWTQKHEKWLKIQKFEHRAHEVTFLDYLHEVEHVAERITRLELAIDEAIDAAPEEIRAVVAALQALRGVAKVTSATIVAEVGKLSRFEKPPQLI